MTSEVRRPPAPRNTSVRVRDATESDLPAVLAIYNDAIRNTTAVWADEPADLSSRLRWLRDRQGSGYPVLVAEMDSQVCGFASFGDFRGWAGYRHTAEHSVYVAEDLRGHGIGRKLLAVLLERAKAAGKHVLVGGVEAGNAASIGLHQALGFQEAGRLRQVGAKFGRWLDLVFLEIRLDHRAAPSD